MYWDDRGPTIDEIIKGDDALNSIEKRLLLQKSRIDLYRSLLVMVLCLLLMGSVGVFIKGWTLALVDGVIFWSTAISYTVLEDKKTRIDNELAEEFGKQRKSKKKSRT